MSAGLEDKNSDLHRAPREAKEISIMHKARSFRLEYFGLYPMDPWPGRGAGERALNRRD